MARQTLSLSYCSTTILSHLNPTRTSLSQIQEAHSYLLKTGLLSNHTHISTKLISLYANLLRFFDATLILNSITKPDAFSYSTLISACSKTNHFDRALRLLSRMVSQCIIPDNYVIPSGLKACAGVFSPEMGRQVHGIAVVSGFATDSFVESSLVHMYVKSSKIMEARNVFDRMTERNVVCWSSMVSGYAREGCVIEANEIFEGMRSSGVEPNVVSWNGLIAGFSHSGNTLESVYTLRRMHCDGFMPDGTSIASVLPMIGEMEDLRMGIQVHCYVLKMGIGDDKCVLSALIDMYGKCGCTNEILNVFEGMGTMDVGSCNALLTALSRNGLVDKALEVFRDFEKQGVELNVVSWTSVIASCTQNGKDIEALDLFTEMQYAGVKPNSITIPCLLPACANIAALRHGKAAHGFSVRRGISLDFYVSSALIDMYAKCGRIGDARSCFDGMFRRNLVCWNAILGGYAMHGKAEEAMKIFDMMQKSGQNPDFISFMCILSACSQSGLAEEGWKYFNSMSEEHGIEARMEHFACMVTLLSRAGKLEEAYAMIKKMPSEPDACVWGALLSSCRVYANVGLAEIAAERLFKFEPSNAGNYVLLSNIYAAKGMWKEENSVRNTMKRIGLTKNPGCSWIELKNKVHMLFAGNKSHPQMMQIIEKLNKLSTEMKNSGCFPDTNFVLQDVDEQEKEHILCGHSEKLAVGLGLLNTPPGYPLRVIKNLRICGDCHAVIKFISGFEGREIFIRDTNRFHHFKDGACSCGDYW